MVNQHGGNITAFAKEISCQPSEVIDLSSNINFVKPTIHLDFNTLNISAYPNYDALENSIASLYGMKPSELELFNGATSAIYALFRNLQTKEVTLYAPLYLEYEKASSLNGYNITHIERFDDIEKEPKENSLVVFVNPSTPDGCYYEMDKLMELWMKKGCTILVDESFLDFTPYSSVIPYLKRYEKLYVLKSMTKFYSSAGIRIGALLSTEENIKTIKAKEPLWKISEFDSHYLQEALKDKAFASKSREINEENRAYLREILKGSSYISKIYHSNANFILCKLDKIDAFNFQKQLNSHKIMVRNCANFQGLDKSFVRIAVKEKFLLNKLEKALKKIEIT